ncbi:hypothetical protein EPUL_006072, partial [Erysiphe pulchra]
SALPSNKALPQKLQNTEENTWASIARKGNHVTPAIPSLSAIPSNTQKHLRADKEKGKHPKHFTGDDRLFLRLTKEHEWRPLAPSAIRELICKHLECSLTDILLIRRIATGFALTAKDKETRKLLLNKSSMISAQNAVIEPASYLVTYHIPNVPVAIQSPNNKVFVTKDMTTRQNQSGTPYQSWLAHFPRSHTPRVGFRIFDESGLALVHKPRQNILQCKRYLGFHSTRGCSRAPACANCASTMHLTFECKGLIKCRNCGGPHKLDSRNCRNCLARPSRTGPPSKEQLVTIWRMGQREYHAAARPNAAVLRAEVATAVATAAATTPSQSENTLENNTTSAEIIMLEASGDDENNTDTQL